MTLPKPLTSRAETVGAPRCENTGTRTSSRSARLNCRVRDRRGSGSAASAELPRVPRPQHLGDPIDTGPGNPLTDEIADVVIDDARATSSMAICTSSGPAGSRTTRAMARRRRSIATRRRRQHDALEDRLPSSVMTDEPTCASAGGALRSPGTRGAGSQTKLTRVWPSAAGHAEPRTNQRAGAAGNARQTGSAVASGAATRATTARRRRRPVASRADGQPGRGRR